jgi:hypothetical protein
MSIPQSGGSFHTRVRALRGIRHVYTGSTAAPVVHFMLDAKGETIRLLTDSSTPAPRSMCRRQPCGSHLEDALRLLEIFDKIPESGGVIGWEVEVDPAGVCA